jgi:aspartate/methionine/tyrosine aminotransferase
MSPASRLAPFGSTIFSDITRQAQETGAINLGQGFPDWDGPDFVKQAAVAAIRSGDNQYPPSSGMPALKQAVAASFSAATGLAVEPDTEVTITSGCTEALAACFLGLIEPGEEIILIEPTYDAYPVGCALAGAVPRHVTLRPPRFDLPEDELRAAFNARTRAIVVNTPHNPTGKVLSRAELHLIAELCIAHDAIAITDEVYEHIIFDAVHLSLASLPGMWERTVTLSSLGKSFSLTGWKTGWAIAPPVLTAGVRSAHQFLTFTTPNPMQLGAVAALSAPSSYYQELVASYRSKRDLLAQGLGSLGFGVFLPQGTYFLMADHTPFGFEDDITFVQHMIRRVGVAAIPPSAFYHRKEDGRPLVRFAFCKSEDILHEALERLQRLRS